MAEEFWDASSAEPVLPEAQQARLAAQGAGWGDPDRLHLPGRLAAQALDAARHVVAGAVGARPDEVVFPSSGVHAAHAAVAGLALGRRRVGDIVVTSTIEHSSVLGAADAAGRRVAVPVNDLGTSTWSAGRPRCAPPVSPWPVSRWPTTRSAPGSRSTRRRRPALGRRPRAARGRPLAHPYSTDDHQGGRWPGPPDAAAVHAPAVAPEVWLRSGRAVSDRQRNLVDRLRAGILAGVPDVEVAGDPVDRVPHLLTFSALYVDGGTLILELDRAGFAVASGSACSASSEHPSHALAAMGLLTHGNSGSALARRSTAAQVESFLAVLPGGVAGIRARLGAPGSLP